MRNARPPRLPTDSGARRTGCARHPVAGVACGHHLPRYGRVRSRFVMVHVHVHGGCVLYTCRREARGRTRSGYSPSPAGGAGAARAGAGPVRGGAGAARPRRGHQTAGPRASSPAGPGPRGPPWRAPGAGSTPSCGPCRTQFPAPRPRLPRSRRLPKRPTAPFQAGGSHRHQMHPGGPSAVVHDRHC